MKEDRKLEIIDKMWDMLVDHFGTNESLRQLKRDYALELSEDEIKYLKRGNGYIVIENRG